MILNLIDDINATSFVSEIRILKRFLCEHPIVNTTGLWIIGIICLLVCFLFYIAYSIVNKKNVTLQYIVILSLIPAVSGVLRMLLVQFSAIYEFSTDIALFYQDGVVIIGEEEVIFINRMIRGYLFGVLGMITSVFMFLVGILAACVRAEKEMLVK